MTAFHETWTELDNKHFLTILLNILPKEQFTFLYLKMCMYFKILHSQFKKFTNLLPTFFYFFVSHIFAKMLIGSFIPTCFSSLFYVLLLFLMSNFLEPRSIIRLLPCFFPIIKKKFNFSIFSIWNVSIASILYGVK